MYKILKPWASIADFEAMLDHLYQSNYEPDKITACFLRCKAVNKTTAYHFNLSKQAPGEKAFVLMKDAEIYAYFSPDKQPENLDMTKLYYEQVHRRGTKRGTWYLIVLVTLVFLGIYVPLLPTFFTGWLTVIVIAIAAVDIVNQRRFARKLYLPFLKEHGFSDDQLQQRFVLKMKTKLSDYNERCLSEIGTLEYLSFQDETYFYQLICFETRRAVQVHLDALGLTEIDVISTVR